MLKQIIKDLSIWLYELAGWMRNYDNPENWWAMRNGTNGVLIMMLHSISQKSLAVK